MGWYRKEDSQIASAVIASITRHLWYLTEELVVLALFNESLSDFTRMLIAKRLFITPRPSTFEIGKPNFPKINLSAQAPFHEFIGPRSWLLFFLIETKQPSRMASITPAIMAFIQ
jgi:hypothetical protein